MGLSEHYDTILGKAHVRWESACMGLSQHYDTILARLI